MDQYQRTGRSRKKTMETFWQGIFYIGAFAISWIPWLLFGFREYVEGQFYLESYYGQQLLTPLHGVLNALVYFRPRLKAERERNPTDSICKSLMQVLHIKYCCNRKSKEVKTNNQQAEKDAEMGTVKKVPTNPLAVDPEITINPEAVRDAEIEPEKKVTTNSFAAEGE
jgi:hypothetical protein